MADPAKIVALMTLMNMERLAQGLVAQNVRAWAADSGDEDLVDGIIATFDSGEVLRRFIPVYAEVLDDATIDGLLDFFMTPAGRRFIAAQDALLPRFTEIAHAYTLELAERATPGSNS